MVIGCERCSTLYELDETVLSAAGSLVQCTRCEHVFTAFPPAPGQALVGVSAVPAKDAAEPAAAAPEVPAPAPPSEPSRATGEPARAAPSRAAPAPEPAARTARSGPAPVYRPPPSSRGASAGGTGARAPLVRRDTIGTFEARLRWSARLRWLVPAAAALVVAGVIGAWLALSREESPAANVPAERRERAPRPREERVVTPAPMAPAASPAAVLAPASGGVAPAPSGAPAPPGPATAAPPAAPSAWVGAPPTGAPEGAAVLGSTPEPVKKALSQPRKRIAQPPSSAVLEPAPIEAPALAEPVAAPEKEAASVPEPGASPTPSPAPALREGGAGGETAPPPAPAPVRERVYEPEDSGGGG